MENKIECPNCLGQGEEFNRRTKKPKECKLCEGEGSVEEIVSDAYLHQMIPSMEI